MIASRAPPDRPIPSRWAEMTNLRMSRMADGARWQRSNSALSITRNNDPASFPPSVKSADSSSTGPGPSASGMWPGDPMPSERRARPTGGSHARLG